MTRARRGWMIAALLALAVWTPGSAQAAEREAEGGPRLILPGSHVVQPGENVALAWTPDDRVSELEIVLSLDGGRTYPIWISPRLSPRDCRFVWRVPGYAARSLRMRIRFNRGGREIEGAPTASLVVVSAGAPEPLGLPASSGEPTRAPRPSSESNGARAAWTARTARPSPPRPATHLRLPPPRTRTVSFAASVPSSASPRFVPLRA